MRRRVRSRVLTSVRTATRNFDLLLAIATLRLPVPALFEIGTNPNDSGSVWGQQGGGCAGEPCGGLDWQAHEASETRTHLRASQSRWEVGAELSSAALLPCGGWRRRGCRRNLLASAGGVQRGDLVG